VVQFRSAYRLLVRHEISGSIYGNCTILDNADTENILFVSANKRMDADAICNNYMNDINDIDEQILFEEFEHDYEYRVPEFEDFIIDIVKYTCGFIVRKMRRAKNICNICDSFLNEKDDENSPILYQSKTRGKLINSSSDVHKTCLAAEYIIRLNSDDIQKKKYIHQILCLKTMNEVSQDPTIFNSQIMKNHILNQDMFIIIEINCLN